MTEHEPRRRCPTCGKAIFESWADASRAIQDTKMYRNQRGFKTYSAKECGQSGWHIGEGNDHAYQNREKRNRTRGAKRAAWRQLAGGDV